MINLPLVNMLLAQRAVYFTSHALLTIKECCGFEQITYGATTLSAKAAQSAGCCCDYKTEPNTCMT